MHIAFRLLVAAVVIVAPSLLFLGLWRGLMRLRDDDLIDRLPDEEPVGSPLDTDLGRGLLGLQGSVGEQQDEAVVCDACGARNVEHARYCGHCLKRLDGE